MAHKLDASSPVLGWTRATVCPVLDRRRLFGLATAVGAAAAVAHLGPGVAPSVAANRQELALPSSGHTWLLASADALRPDAPNARTAAELEELLDLQSKRTDATSEM